MRGQFSGPMFEPARGKIWRSTHNKTGAHYNIFGADDEQGLDGLRAMFPGGEADSMNFVLFSTSGVHGMYTTIEEAEAVWKNGGKDEDGEDGCADVTFLIVQPRIVCLRYGNCQPKTQEDFDFLKHLRESSWEAVSGIGK